MKAASKVAPIQLNGGWSKWVLIQILHQWRILIFRKKFAKLRKALKEKKKASIKSTGDVLILAARVQSELWNEESSQGTLKQEVLTQCPAQAQARAGRACRVQWGPHLPRRAPCRVRAEWRIDTVQYYQINAVTMGRQSAVGQNENPDWMTNSWQQKARVGS